MNNERIPYPMDQLQAWHILYTHCFPNESFHELPDIIVDAIEVLDKHLDSRMTGEDETDVIVSESECQSEAWNDHLNWLFHELIQQT